MSHSNGKSRDQEYAALHLVRSNAKKAKPTQKHRPAIWENMLGTLYAMNDRGQVKYFDYAYFDAVEFAGITKENVPTLDIRVERNSHSMNYGYEYMMPRKGQLVWYVLRKDERR